MIAFSILIIWSLSSVGRAPGLHPVGRGFKSLSDHHRQKSVSQKNISHWVEEFSLLADDKNIDKSIIFDKNWLRQYNRGGEKISRLDTGKKQAVRRSVRGSIQDSGTRVSRTQKETSLREKIKVIIKKKSIAS